MNGPTSFIRGYVKIMIRGERCEQFVNLAAGKNVEIWDMRYMAGQGMRMKIMLADFFRIRPLLRQTSCRVHVEARYGLPFALQKMGRRKAFITGFFLFFVGLYLLSSLVWKVDVQGNMNIAEDDILKAARAEGIYVFQWSFRLKSQEELSRQLTHRLPGVSWVGVEKRGANITINVAESTKPEAKQLMNPRHLVAKADAVVTEIFTEQGRAKVRKNSRVKKGSILISGIIGSDQNPQAVVAKGKVKGLVWHEYQVSVPLLQKERTYTGAFEERNYIITGNRALQVSGYGKVPYDKYETITERSDAQIGPYKLPVGWMTEKLMEVHYIERHITEDEARKIAMEHAKSDALVKNGPDAKIRDENILHQEVKNGKVYLNIHFEVEQWIAEELPIIHQ
ncbi:sporulation protein YqfD [Paenibacillus terrigena]|uniref:sporulation protein YqfD n=1 Tax=Paenibacillus terrigena TaxID=369333 RepID=UPI0003627F4F|nr:sporulation protein YqfD [Paenibacillus terrigena]